MPPRCENSRGRGAGVLAPTRLAGYLRTSSQHPFGAPTEGSTMQEQVTITVPAEHTAAVRRDALVEDIAGLADEVERKLGAMKTRMVP